MARTTDKTASGSWQRAGVATRGIDAGDARGSAIGALTPSIHMAVTCVRSAGSRASAKRLLEPVAVPPSARMAGIRVTGGGRS